MYHSLNLHVNTEFYVLVFFPEYRLKDKKIIFKSVMENVKIKSELQNVFKKCYYSIKINRSHVECIIMMLQKKYIFWTYFRNIVSNYCCDI